MQNNDIDIICPSDDWLDAPTQTIIAALYKTARYIEVTPPVIICSVSGGADSDIMVDMLYRVDKQKKVRYVFYNTGLEMQATKDHITYLEKKYGIHIDEVTPKKTIPTACKKYGQPFFSKQISEYIERLQRHNFQWELEPLETLLKRYPKCKAALRWWCNDYGEKSRFNIAKQPFLKEFMHKNPPQFKISPKCCKYAKKAPSVEYARRYKANLTCLGIRKAEGGARSVVYNSCFCQSSKYGNQHFPLFWFTDTDKREYDFFYKIEHSKAYTVYKCKRTGCSACPFGSRFEQELEMLNRYEPKLYTAAMNIFGDSINYTRAYREFKATKHKEPMPDQLTFEDLMR